MKILQACIRFPPAPGGAETHVLSISKELLNLGHEVRVVTSNLYKETPFTPKYDWEPRCDGLEVIRFPAYSLQGEMHYVFFPKCVPYILSTDAEIIHAHSYGYFHVNVCAFARMLKKRPFVFTPHYHPPWSMWGGKKRKKLRWLYDKIVAKPVLDAADAVIGVSRHEIDTLKDVWYDKNKIHIIPNGIDLKKFTPIPSPEPFRKKYDLKEEKIVLFAGRLATNKGLEYLVEASPKIVAEHPNVRFAIVGEDQGLADILKKKSNKLGTLKKFIFTGHVEEEILRSAFSACDVFVLPSEYEAFGIVLLEANACLKPCVATKVGGVPEVIEDGKNGILVEYADTNELANAICELLSDKEKSKRMGEYGRKKVSEKFTWEMIAKEIEKLYNRLLT